MPLKPFNAKIFLGALGKEQKSSFFRKRETIFSHGDRSDSIFYIAKGNVKLTVTSVGGKEAVIGFFSQGDFFGESCLSSNAPTRFHTATAFTDMRVVKVGRKTLLRVLRADAEAALFFITYLVRRNQQIQEDLINSLLSSSEDRLTRVLSALGQLGQSGEAIPKVTQQDLANMLGVTRQRVNSLMKRLAKPVSTGFHGARAGRTGGSM